MLGHSQFVEMLNVLGRAGWECFHIECLYNGPFEEHKAFLKREIKG